MTLARPCRVAYGWHAGEFYRMEVDHEQRVAAWHRADPGSRVQLREWRGEGLPPVAAWLPCEAPTGEDEEIEA